MEGSSTALSGSRHQVPRDIFHASINSLRSHVTISHLNIFPSMSIHQHQIEQEQLNKTIEQKTD